MLFPNHDNGLTIVFPNDAAALSAAEAQRVASWPKHMMTVDEDEIVRTATETWFARIDAKPPEARAPLTARHTIVSVDQSNGAAAVKVRLDFGTHAFIDYLSLLETKRGWRIVDKIYATVNCSL